MGIRTWMIVGIGALVLTVFAVALVSNSGTRLDATSPSFGVDTNQSLAPLRPYVCPPGKLPSFANGEFRGCYTPGPNFDDDFYRDCLLKLGSAWSAYCLVLADKATGHILYPPALDAWKDKFPGIPVPGKEEEPASGADPTTPPTATPVNPGDSAQNDGSDKTEDGYTIYPGAGIVFDDGMVISNPGQDGTVIVSRPGRLPIVLGPGSVGVIGGTIIVVGEDGKTTIELPGGKIVDSSTDQVVAPPPALIDWKDPSLGLVSGGSGQEFIGPPPPPAKEEVTRRPNALERGWSWIKGRLGIR